MDLDKNLIESGSRKSKKSWRGMTGSLVAHGALFGLVAVLSLNATEKVDAEEKPVPVYMEQAAAPPPPPPPPPPAGAPATPQKATPKIEVPQPVEVPKFVAPVEVPKTVPTVEAPATTEVAEASEPLAPGTPIGVPGGVQGGTVGGEVGGELGGVIGGVQGGVVGGTPGGVLGGTPGGTGTAPAPAPVVAPPAPAAPSGPVRVGGDVRAPVVVTRVEPKYTELARRSRVTGTVIVEAIIDKHGNVDRVRVVKGLPMGLSEAATDAVRRWKFRPGTQQGRPVDVIFNLTVVFTLGSDGPAVTGASRMPVRPQPSRQKAPAKPVDPPAAAVEPAPAPAPEPTPEPAPEPEVAPEAPDSTTP